MGGDIMIDVILILAIITGLTIVAVRYGSRLLALGGVALARAFEETDHTEPDFEEEWQQWEEFELDDPVNALVPGNASYHVYKEFRHELHSETG